MAKWSGMIGFENQAETEPGVWEDCIVEKKYFGDFLKNYRSLDDKSQINDSVSISNQISFVSDPYARNNFFKIRYATFMGAKWKVKNIDVQLPRIVLSLGELYNEQ